MKTLPLTAYVFITSTALLSGGSANAIETADDWIFSFPPAPPTTTQWWFNRDANGAFSPPPNNPHYTLTSDLTFSFVPSFQGGGSGGDDYEFSGPLGTMDLVDAFAAGAAGEIVTTFEGVQVSLVSPGTGLENGVTVGDTTTVNMADHFLLFDAGSISYVESLEGAIVAEDTVDLSLNPMELLVVSGEAVFGPGSGGSLEMTLHSDMSPSFFESEDVQFVFDFFVEAIAAQDSDFNLDGAVNLLDLDILGANWQMPGTSTTGDANGDGFVDLLDLDVLGSQWNSGASFAEALAVSGLNVPEPGLAGLVMGLALPSLLRRRRAAQIKTELK